MHWGLLTFIGTIIIGTVVSVVFKPVLYHNYLLPAAGVLWLSISIIVPKINNKKRILPILILILLIGEVNVYKECSLSLDEYDNTLYEQNLLDSINNNDSVVIFKTDNRFVRTYWALDKVYEKYASYSLNNKTYTLDNPNFDANYTTLDLPKDLDNFNDKNIYLIAFNQKN